MLTIFTVRTTVDYTFLRDFYHKTIAETYTPAEKKAILNRFLSFHKETGVSLNVADLFNHSTINGIAHIVDQEISKLMAEASARGEWQGKNETYQHPCPDYGPTYHLWCTQRLSLLKLQFQTIQDR